MERIKGKKVAVSLLFAIIMVSILFSTGVFAANVEVGGEASVGNIIVSDATPNTKEIGVEYRGHVQDYGDYPTDGTWIQGDNTLGTTGESKRIEGVNIELTTGKAIPAGASIRYNVHIENEGWQNDPTNLTDTSNWKANGDFAGSKGKCQRIEAIQIVLVGADGQMLPGYSVQYLVHGENYGWAQGWKADGAIAGTTGQSLRLEAIQIKIVKNAATAYDNAGTYGSEATTTVVNNDVIVNANDVVLQNLHIKGDLIVNNDAVTGTTALNENQITAETSVGGINLNNVIVDGTTYVRSGGENSTHIIGGNYNDVFVREIDSSGLVFDLSGQRTLTPLTFISGGAIINGGYLNIEVRAPGLSITTTGRTVIDNFQIAAAATGSNINLGADATVGNMLISGDNTNISGQGTINHAAVDANNIVYQRPPISQTVAPDVSVPPVVKPDQSQGGGATIVVPTVKVTNLTFVDTDTDAGQIGGTVSWTSPSDISSVTAYAVYASADGTTKGNQIGTDVAVGTNQLTIPTDTPYAPYIIVVAKNTAGEAITANYASVAVTDKAVPTVKVTGVTFTDLDMDENQMSGTVSWTAPSDVSNVTAYAVYASANGTTKGTQIGTDVAVGTNQLAIPANTPYAANIIVVAKNTIGEATAANYVSIGVTDAVVVPITKVTNLLFSDIDLDKNEMGGIISWNAPSDISNVTAYAVYASADGTIKGTQIGTDVAVGTNQLVIPADTSYTPYIIVVAKNTAGEAITANYASVAVTDKAVPTVKVTGVIFTDLDTDENQMSGTVSWTAPSDVSNVTAYAVYASANGTTKGTQIGTDVTVGTNQLAIPVNTPYAAYIIVAAKNTVGEANSVNYASTAVVDVKAVPIVKVANLLFTDTDADTGQMEGTLSWTAPSDITSVTAYAVYASADGTTKGTQIGTDVAVGTNQLAIPADTPYSPYIIVVAKNTVGEAITANYASIAVTDKSVPTVKVSGVTFTDIDTDENQMSGTVSWTAPSDVSNVTAYAVYASANGTTKGTQIGTDVAVGTNQVAISANTPYAAYIIVAAKNTVGEANSVNYASTAVVDVKAVPIVKVANLLFTDTDADTGHMEGTLSWTAPSDITSVMAYAVYASADGTTKGTQIGTDVAVGTNQLAIPADTPYSPYIIVVAKNTVGEAITANYASIAVIDKSVPTVKVSGVTFTDIDTDENQMSGTVSWTAPSDVSNVTAYAVYASTNGTTKGIQIGTDVAVGTNQLAIPANTPYVAYIIVAAKNTVGEANSANYAITAVVDVKAVPTVKVTNLSFTNTDTDVGKMGGTVSWTEPSDVTSVTAYAVYASANGTDKGAQIGADVLVGTNQLTFSDKTYASYIIVVAKNTVGEAISSYYAKITVQEINTATFTGGELGDDTGVLTLNVTGVAIGSTFDISKLTVSGTSTNYNLIGPYKTVSNSNLNNEGDIYFSGSELKIILTGEDATAIMLLPGYGIENLNVKVSATSGWNKNLSNVPADAVVGQTLTITTTP
ncbi:hypothetical protein [Acetobacterium tundrae]|nr:hypothetical protein [Acetobacterium tundrae]